jgi:hypothetical protein
MQVDPFSGQASLTQCIAIKKKYHGDLYTFQRRGLSFACDPNHRFYAEWRKDGLASGKSVQPRPIHRLRSTMCLPLVADYKPVVQSDMQDSDIRFLAAYLSDGSLKNPRTVQFNVSRQDKCRFLESMKPRGIYKRKKLYGKNLKLATNYVFSPPAGFHQWLDGNKCISWETALSWNAHQRNLFLETYKFFDGSPRKNASTIYTTSTEIVDLIQALAFLSHNKISYSRAANSFDGVRTKDMFSIHYSNTHNSLSVSRDHLRIEPFSGNLYCVNVPSGAFVARGGAMPFISGNCSGFVNYIMWLLRLPRSKSLKARSWLNIGRPVNLSLAQIGFDIVILWRGTPKPGVSICDGPGHVGFYAGCDECDSYDNGKIYLLGGNQNDEVNLRSYPVERVLGIRRVIKS